MPISEVTWYARLAVWVGIVVLFIQSLTGRGNPAVTLVAVILLILGFSVFLAGLAATGSSSITPALAGSTADSATPRNDRHGPPPTSTEHVSEAQGVEPRAVEERDRLPEPVPDTSNATPETPSRARWGSVVAVDVTRDTPELGSICPRCHIGIQEGQIAATCFVCGRAHHATCWTDNHFHCATPGCAGRGSLEAPPLPGSGASSE